MGEPLKAALQGGLYAPSSDGQLADQFPTRDRYFRKISNGRSRQAPVLKTKSERIDDDVRRGLAANERFQSTESGERLADSGRTTNKSLFRITWKIDFQTDQKLGKQSVCLSTRAEI
jgi:hypothetical protein